MGSCQGRPSGARGRQPPLARAVAEVEGGVVISVHLTPGAKRSGFTGYDPWRERLEISVKAAPQKGAANAELVELVREIFSCQAAVLSGHTSRQKRVGLDGLNRLEVISNLEGILGRQRSLDEFGGGGE